MNTMSISRRKFAQLLGIGAATVVVRPPVSFAKPTQSTATSSTAGGGIVRLSANENPYGPCPKALQAITDSFGLACRYPDEHNNVLIDKLANLNNVDRSEILLGDGSGEILKLCAETFTGPQNGKLVAADPTFEAILTNATANGAEVIKVPLTSSFAHDLPKMLAATKGGLIYVCNPNNPTASITPKDELRDFIAKTPRETEHPNLIVSRTFSKIYGMAGLRCGYCVAQKETIERMRRNQMWDSVNCMALAAATASLNDPDHVPNGQRLNKEAKQFTTFELEKMGYKSIPSQANFIMFDCKHPVVPIIKALKDRGVHVGRLFPALPNHMRLTIGKKSEMETFLTAFREVMA